MSRCLGRSMLMPRWSMPRLLMLMVLAAAVLLGLPILSIAQRGIGGFGGSVGGVKIDPSGVLANATEAEVNAFSQVRQESLREVPGDLKRPAELRKISLRRLETAIETTLKAGKPLDDAMVYLAGLQRIRYVFVYPERNDIVIAGYAESWKIDSHGNTVGATTARPVMLLDDLYVALRAVRSGGNVITCSIDPTPEGLARLQEYASKLTTITDPQREAHVIEQMLGPQTITITGVPPTSHFARVLVAADYRMKRLGMKLEPSPVSGLVSYLDMIRPNTRGMQSMTPRWWMVPNYDPILTDGQGLAWELRGASVKALTEETLFGEAGSKSQTGKVNPIAQAWANAFTNKYEELSHKDTIFGQLRNCIELAVLATLIVKHDLTGKATYQMPVWLDDATLPFVELPAPRTTETQVSYLRRGNNWVVTASGGVQLGLEQIVARTEQSAKLDPVRDEAQPAADAQNWWWD